MPFPQKITVKDSKVIKIAHKYLAELHELTINREKCVSCGQCSISCPKDAIIFHSPSDLDQSVDTSQHAYIIDMIDPEKCVFCGNCTIFCPFEAIYITNNGILQKISDMKIIKYRSIPTLKIQEIVCTNPDHKAKIYWEGEIAISNHFPSEMKKKKEYYSNFCPEKCNRCANVCPTDAISFIPLEKLKENENAVIINQEKCIKCSACQQVCPEKIFSIIWTNIKSKGPFNPVFWEPLRDKLLNQKVVMRSKLNTTQ